MKCEDCEKPAVVHSSIVVDGEKKEIHCCRSCAEKRKMIPSGQPLHLPMVVSPLAVSTSVATQDHARLACPECGTKYMDFRRLGRLGCPNDYLVFREGLIVLLERFHRAARHAGKRPKRWRDPIESRADERALRSRLRKAIEEEAYEEAALLRDAIRGKERPDGP